MKKKDMTLNKLYSLMLGASIMRLIGFLVLLAFIPFYGINGLFKMNIMCFIQLYL